MPSIAHILGQPFDAQATEPVSMDRDLVAPGTYLAEITATELRETKNGDGQFIVVEHTILEGPAARRKLWSNLNIRNANPKAEEIARGQLSAICRAVGKHKLEDTDELVGQTVRIKVGVKPAKEPYPAQNTVTAWESPAASPMPAAPIPGTVKPAQAARPWAK